VLLSLSQEEIILDELKRGWESRTAEEIQKYNSDPLFVELILLAKQKDIDEIRLELENGVREWLNGTDQTDPAVIVVRSQLNDKSRILIPGTVPLTVRGATATSELCAYSDLLGRNPEARPDQISADQVSDIRRQLVEEWKAFTEGQKKQVMTTSGLWLSLRALLQHGKAEEQAMVRARIQKIAAPAGKEDGEPSDAGKKAVMSVSKHMVLVEIQKMTFDKYLYSRRAWSLN
jgi:hypothetical protein